mgnify:CR=1 FL=1
MAAPYRKDSIYIKQSIMLLYDFRGYAEGYTAFHGSGYSNHGG